MADFDSPWKEALDAFFEAFLEFFFPRAHADIDWSRGWVSLDKELQQIAPEAAIGRRYVDKLVKVWLKSGEEQWVLVHVEVQMDRDGKFGWRMYVYNCGVFLKYNKMVASFAVLGDDSPSWRPNEFGYELWGTEAGIRFPVVKLLDYAEKRAELEGNSNPFATVVLAHLDTQQTRGNPRQRKDRKFALMKRLLERGWTEKKVRQLFRLIDWMMQLPQDLRTELSDQVTRYQKEKEMPFIDMFEERGIVRGRLESIETILELRFPAAATELMSEIRQIRDHEELKNIHRGAVTASSPDELRKLLADTLAGHKSQE